MKMEVTDMDEDRVKGTNMKTEIEIEDDEEGSMEYIYDEAGYQTPA